MAPTSACQGNAESPATPRVTMVRNGPDSMLMMEYAATSRGLPNCPMSAMYRPPLVSFIAATTANVEMPARTPLGTGASPSRRPSRIPTRIAEATLAANSAPPFLMM